jgi:hypothetical protein
MAMARTEPLTPAQSRVESVGRTLDAAMNRASTLMLTPDEIAALKADFPDEAFKPGAAGKEHLIYIEHAFLRDRMDQVLGMGQWALLRTRPLWAEEFRTEKGQQATRIYADCALIVRGCMVSEAIGDMVYYPNNASQNYGDAAEGAMTAAFRRCAKNFGVGLQAWKKDFGDGWWARKRGQTPRQNAPPRAPAPAPRVETPKPAPWTPEQWVAWLLEQCEPYPTEATEVFAAHGLLVPNESFGAATVQRFQGWTGAEIKQLLADVKAAAAEANQIPGAEVPDEGSGQGSPASAPADPPPGLPAGCQSKVITVKSKAAKVGTKKNGQSYTRHGICSTENEWFNTFSDTIAAKAVEGETVTAWYTVTQYGNDLHGVS